jgi:uncharacterized protein (TIGR00251 family)
VTPVRITVRLTPKGGRDAVEGWMMFNDERVLKARVSAAPEDGKANAALIVLLAKTLGIAKSRIRIASGETSRMKIIEIEASADVSARLPTLGEKP